MTILQICAYGAPAAGNFISSLLELEKQIKIHNCKIIYAFPERAKDKDWCKKIQANTKVYFLPEAKARIHPKTYDIFRKIYKENNIDIIHSHFELYDIPATIMAPKNVKIFWHLHDPISVEKNLRGILWRIQYGIIGRKATLLSVSDFYRRAVVAMGFPEKNTATVLNGIDINRIEDCSNKNFYNYDFLTFGWDFYRKGDDLILKACDKLSQNGYKFKFLLNGNDQTWAELDNYLKGQIPDYLICGNPVNDINQLFRSCNVFIQASRKETFSYAVCEAAYAGCPVICSDIPGLEWAHSIPSIDFFTNEDVDSLYLLMKSYLDNNKIINNSFDEVRCYINNNLTLNIWAKNIIEHYKI